MRKISKVLLAVVFVVVCSFFSVNSFAETVIVKLKPKAAAKRVVYEKLGFNSSIGMASIDNLNKELGVEKIRQLVKKIKQPELDTGNELSRTMVFEIPEGMDTQAVIDELSKDPNVESVEFDAPASVNYVPNDPWYVLQQWYLNNNGTNAPARATAGCDIKAETAWDRTQGSGDVTIAIVDSGVDMDHEDLSANIWRNTDEIPGNGKDDDGNGYIDDVNGWNFVDNNNNPNDSYYHGTRMAGIVAAAGNNSIGITGVTWRCKIMPVKVMNYEGHGVTSAIAAGIIYAADNGAKIINLSLGGAGCSAEEDACKYAYAKGCVLIASTGNDSNPNFTQAPAIYDCVIAVGSTNQNDVKSEDSNYGPKLELVAPGEYIYSTYPNGYYTLGSGTSSATAVVSGSAALLLSLNPSLPNTEIRAALRDMTDDLGSAGFDTEYGQGRINLSKMKNILYVPSAYYPSIQSAINAATSGSTVIVGKGTYSENIAMKDGIVLKGKGYEKTVINGTVVFSGISNAELIGFEVTGGSNGVEFNNSPGGVVKNCYIHNNSLTGISVTNSSPKIVNNTVKSCKNGISIGSGSRPIVKNNIIVSNTNVGIYGSSGASPSISYNNVWNNAVLNYQGVSVGSGDVCVNPMFDSTLPDSVTDYSMYQYTLRLSPSSICLNTGDPASEYNDIDGSRNDMGAFGGNSGADFSPKADIQFNDTFPLFMVSYGEGMNLDGQRSSVPSWQTEGSSISYKWELVSMPSGSAVSSSSFSTTTGVCSEFHPDIKGCYGIKLTVSSSRGLSKAYTKTVNVLEGKELYVGSDYATISDAFRDAVCGDTVVVLPGVYYENSLSIPYGVRLKGVASSVCIIDGKNIENYGIISAGGSDVIEGITFRNFKYSGICPCAQDDILVVLDSELPDSSTPVAYAGENMRVSVGDTITLDGSGSFDPNGRGLIYNWSICQKPSGSCASISESGSVNPSIYIDVEGIYKIALTVNNGTKDSYTDYLYIFPNYSIVVPYDCGNIEDAVNQAVSGDSIYVCPGEYFIETNYGMEVHEGVTIKGAGAEETIIRSREIQSMITLEDNASIEGFTLYQYVPRDVFLCYTNIICIAGSNCTVKNNIIVTNGLEVLGISFGYNGGNPIENTNIYNNVFYGYNYGCFGIFTRAEPLSKNTRIVNNTFKGFTGAVYVYDAKSVLIENNIFYDNSVWTFGDFSAAAEYNCCYGFANISPQTITTSNTLNADPFFVDPVMETDPEASSSWNFNQINFRLQKGSPCINAGNPNALYNDLDGSRNDMGAYGGTCREYVLVPGGSNTWYLAEGSTANGFVTWILIQNPNETASTVKITYMDQDANTHEEIVYIQAHSRFTRNIGAHIPEMANKVGVSTKVEVIEGSGVIVERAMYWPTGGGHCSAGVTSSLNTWYLAEGSTANGFVTWILIQNPNETASTVKITYMDQDAKTHDETVYITAHSRFTRNIGEQISEMANKIGVSTKIEVVEGDGVIAERSMYWGESGGHNSTGVTNPAKTWYLAEGCTAYGFDTWILIQNPYDTNALVTIVYMDQDGGTYGELYTIPAHSRFTKNVGEQVSVMNNKSGVSTEVVCTQGEGVIVERAMYWPATETAISDGTCSAGVAG